MSRWTHSICSECWNARYPGREPVALSAGPREVCCYCGARHNSGIYVREDPKVPQHCDHQEES